MTVPLEMRHRFLLNALAVAAGVAIVLAALRPVWLPSELMRGQYQRMPAVEQSIPMTRRNGDTPLRVERDDRGSVKRCVHPCFTTFFYLFPLYEEMALRSSLFS